MITCNVIGMVPAIRLTLLVLSACVFIVDCSQFNLFRTTKIIQILTYILTSTRKSIHYVILSVKHLFRILVFSFVERSH